MTYCKGVRLDMTLQLQGNSVLLYIPLVRLDILDLIIDCRSRRNGYIRA